MSLYDQRAWLKRSGDEMSGELGMSNFKISKLGAPTVYSDAARDLEVAEIGKTTVARSVPSMTSNTSPTPWSVSVSPAVDATNIYKIFDDSETTAWVSTVNNAYTVTLQKTGDAVVIDELRIIKEGLISNFRIRVGATSALETICEINTVDDDGIFNVTERVGFVFALITFTCTGSVRFTALELRYGNLTVGKALYCHQIDDPRCVVSRQYVDGAIQPISSIISNTFLFPAFTGPSMPGYTVTTSSEILPAYAAWKCLDRNPNTYWEASGTATQQLTITITGNPGVAKQVQLQGLYGDRNFTSWNIYGSLSGLFDDSVDLIPDPSSINLSDILVTVNIPPDRQDLYLAYRFEGVTSPPKPIVGLAMCNYTTGQIGVNFNRIVKLEDPEDELDAVNYRTLVTEGTKYLARAGGSMSGDITMTSNKTVRLSNSTVITGLNVTSYTAAVQMVMRAVCPFATLCSSAYCVCKGLPFNTTPGQSSHVLQLTSPDWNSTFPNYGGDYFNSIQTIRIPSGTHILYLWCYITTNDVDGGITVDVVDFDTSDVIDSSTAASVTSASAIIEIMFVTALTVSRDTTIAFRITKEPANIPMQILNTIVAVVPQNTNPRVFQNVGSRKLIGTLHATPLTTVVVNPPSSSRVAISAFTMGTNTSYSSPDRSISFNMALTGVIDCLFYGQCSNSTASTETIIVALCNAQTGAIIRSESLSISPRVSPIVPSLVPFIMTHEYVAPSGTSSVFLYAYTSATTGVSLLNGNCTLRYLPHLL